MKRKPLLVAAFVLVALSRALAGNTIVCPSTRTGNDTVDWSQLGPPGTPLSEEAVIAYASPVPITVSVFNSYYVLQEGLAGIGGFLGDFAIRDHLLLTGGGRIGSNYVVFEFSTGVSQVGAQVDPYHGPGAIVTATAYDQNDNPLGYCESIVTNKELQNNSAPYKGIAEVDSDGNPVAGIYFIKIDGFDMQLVFNELSLTTPCNGLTTPNLVQNPGFEAGSGFNIPDWTVAWDSTADPYMFVGGNPHSGNNSMWLGSVPGENRISQVIQGTTAGSVYSICFWLANNGSAYATADGSPNSIEVQWNDNDVLEMVNSNFLGYTYFSFNVVANGNNAYGEPTDTLVFQARQVPGFYNLDDVSVNLCAGCSFPPEPSPGTKPTQ